MDPEIDNDNELVPEASWNRTYEDHILEDFTSGRDEFEQQTKLEQEATAQKLWLSFQNSASAITNLYKDCLQEQNCWYPFQNAAGAVTDLYKDASDLQRKSFELGIQVGCSRRIRDIITWARKRRRTIRRDDLVAYLCGKPPPPKPQRHSPPRTRIGSRSLSDRGSPISSVSLATDRESEPDLTAFQNALAIQGLDGAMSNVSVGYSAAARSRSDEINGLIMDGLKRHNESRKRPTSTLDMSNTDSPNRKRYRFL